MIRNVYKKQQGFSLIETLIAVSILMIAIAGPLSLVQAGLFSSNHQRNQITAIYLAQEAVEYIKNLRDTNSYGQYSGGTLGWLTGPDRNDYSLFSSCSGYSGCYVDPHGTLPPTSGNIYVQAVNSNNLPLRQHNIGSLFSYYGYTSGDTVTPYTRTVKISPISGIPVDQEVMVSVTVTWNDNALSRSYTVSENIYNYAQ